MNPVVYGPEHITYIIISLAVAAAAIFCSVKYIKTEKAEKIFLYSAAGILFAIIVANRLTLVFEHGNVDWLKMLPDTFCSASSYVLPLAIVFGKRDNNVLHFIWLIALAGGTITTFYPDFIGQNPSFLYPPTILGMMHHTVAAIIVIILIIKQYVNLTYKKWYCTLFGFTSYFAYGEFLMCVLSYGNPFYMTGPALPNTPFTAWVIAPIYVAVYALILLAVELVRRKKLNSARNL